MISLSSIEAAEWIADYIEVRDAVRRKWHDGAKFEFSKKLAAALDRAQLEVCVHEDILSLREAEVKGRFIQ